MRNNKVIVNTKDFQQEDNKNLIPLKLNNEIDDQLKESEGINDIILKKKICESKCDLKYSSDSENNHKDENRIVEKKQGKTLNIIHQFSPAESSFKEETPEKDRIISQYGDYIENLNKINKKRKKKTPPHNKNYDEINHINDNDKNDYIDNLKEKKKILQFRNNQKYLASSTVKEYQRENNPFDNENSLLLKNKGISKINNEKVLMLNKYSQKLNSEWIPIFDKNGVVYFTNKISGDMSFNFPKIFNKRQNRYENLFFKDWQKIKDKENKIVYWKNIKYGFIQYTKPSSTVYFLEAIFMENLAFVNFYIEYNGNVNVLDKKGRNALHYLAMNDCVEILNILLENKIYIDQQEEKELQTPIFYSLKYSSFRVLKILLTRNADLDIRDLYGNTLLHYCVKLKNKKLILYLINLGSRLDIKNAKSKFPIDVAVDNNDWETVDFIVKLSGLNKKQMLKKNLDNNYLETYNRNFNDNIFRNPSTKINKYVNPDKNQQIEEYFDLGKSNRDFITPYINNKLNFDDSDIEVNRRNVFDIKNINAIEIKNEFLNNNKKSTIYKKEIEDNERRNQLNNMTLDKNYLLDKNNYELNFDYREFKFKDNLNLINGKVNKVEMEDFRSESIAINKNEKCKIKKNEQEFYNDDGEIFYSLSDEDFSSIEELEKIKKSEGIESNINKIFIDKEGNNNNYLNNFHQDLLYKKEIKERLIKYHNIDYNSNRDIVESNLSKIDLVKHNFHKSINLRPENSFYEIKSVENFSKDNTKNGKNNSSISFDNKNKKNLQEEEFFDEYAKYLIDFLKDFANVSSYTFGKAKEIFCRSLKIGKSKFFEVKNRINTYYNKLIFYYKNNPDLENQINYKESNDEEAFYYEFNEVPIEPLNLENEFKLENHKIETNVFKKTKIDFSEKKVFENFSNFDKIITSNNNSSSKLNHEVHRIHNINKIKKFLFNRISFLTFVQISKDLDIEINTIMNESIRKINENYCILNLLRKFILIENINKEFEKYEKKILKVKQKINFILIGLNQLYNKRDLNNEENKSISNLLFYSLYLIYNIYNNVKKNFSRFSKNKSNLNFRNMITYIIKLLPFKNHNLLHNMKIYIQNNVVKKSKSHNFFTKTIFDADINKNYNFNTIIENNRLHNFNYVDLRKFLQENSKSLINGNEAKNNIKYSIKKEKDGIFQSNSEIKENKTIIKKLFQEGFSDLMINVFDNIFFYEHKISEFIPNESTIKHNYDSFIKIRMNRNKERCRKRILMKTLCVSFNENVDLIYTNKRYELRKNKNNILSLSYKYHENYEEIISSIRNLNSVQINYYLKNLEKKIINSNLINFSKNFSAKRYFLNLINYRKIRLRKILANLNTDECISYDSYNSHKFINPLMIEEIKNLIINYNFEEEHKDCIFPKRKKSNEIIDKEQILINKNNLIFKSNYINSKEDLEKKSINREIYSNKCDDSQKNIPNVFKNDSNNQKSDYKENKRYCLTQGNDQSEGNRNLSDESFQNFGNLDEKKNIKLNFGKKINLNCNSNFNNKPERGINLIFKDKEETEILQEKLKHNREINLKTFELLTKKHNKNRKIFDWKIKNRDNSNYYNSDNPDKKKSGHNHNQNYFSENEKNHQISTFQDQIINKNEENNEKKKDDFVKNVKDSEKIFNENEDSEFSGSLCINLSNRTSSFNDNFEKKSTQNAKINIPRLNLNCAISRHNLIRENNVSNEDFVQKIKKNDNDENNSSETNELNEIEEIYSKYNKDLMNVYFENPSKKKK